MTDDSWDEMVQAGAMLAQAEGVAYDCDHASLDGLAGTDLMICCGCYRLVRVTRRANGFATYEVLGLEGVKEAFREMSGE